jgi:hypothetical protein
MRWRIALPIIFIVAVLAVGGVAHAGRVDRLVAILKTDPSYKVRLQVVLYLAKIKDPKATQGLIAALNDSVHTVRGLAASALGNLGAVEARPHLVKASTKDPHHYVRSQAKRALRKLGSKSRIRVTADKRYLITLGKMANKSKYGGSALSQYFGSELLKQFDKAAGVATTTHANAVALGKSLKGKLKAFVLDGAINKLVHRKKGSDVSITISVKVALATFPENSLKGFYSGEASIDVPLKEMAQKDKIHRELIEASALEAKKQIVQRFLSVH